MKNIIILLFLLIGIKIDAQIIYENKKAPELKFTEWINNEKGNAVLEDKHIVLEFWATWCSACIKAMPHINQLTTKYSDKISFVSVNSYDSKSKIEKFLNTTEMVTYNVMDSNKYLKHALEIQTIPATILIDNKGNLRWRGYASDLTEELINTFLNENRIIDLTKNPKVISDKLLIKNDSEDIVIDLTLERFTYDQMQTFTTSRDFNYQDRFFFESKGLPISNTIMGLYISSVDENYTMNWDNEILGEEPKVNYNMSVVSKSGKAKQVIVNEIIKRLESELNFNFKILEKQKELWVLKNNAENLKTYLSKEQNTLNSSMDYDDSTKELRIKNMSLHELAFRLSSKLNEKIVYNSDDRKLYDLEFKIDEDNNVEALQKELMEKYKIQLVKEESKVKVMRLSFL